MTRTSRMGLQSLILLALVPMLVAMTVAVGVIAYREMDRAIIRGFDAKLTAVSTVGAAFIQADRHDGLLAAVQAGRTAEEVAATPDYARLVEPMRRIREELGLTYLYTQVPTGGADIVYILDANTDENHSPPGTTDTLPEEEADSILGVARTGTPYISGIQEWEQWGLIKTGFAAIRDDDGRIVAMAGADVDISIIREKTRVALVSAGLVGTLSLLVSLIVAIAVARRLAEPLRTIKLAGFRLAAGEPGPALVPTGPVEVRRLAAAFNRMATAVRQEMEQAETADLATEKDRRTRCLLRLLEEKSAGWEAGSAGSDGPAMVGQLDLPTGDRIGWVVLTGQGALSDRVRLLQMAELAAMIGARAQDADGLLDRLMPMLGPRTPLVFAVTDDRLLLRSALPVGIGGDRELPPGAHEVALRPTLTLSVAGTQVGIARRAEVAA